MTSLMARLGRDANGNWLGRKSIPSAIRGAYRAHYGVEMDEEFRSPGTTPSAVAWEAFHHWEVGIAVQFDHVRTSVGPKGEALLCREVQSLTREWRAWRFSRGRKRPATSGAWATFLAPVALAQVAEDASEAYDDATVRHRTRAEVTKLGCLNEFLADAEITVVGLGYDRFVDAIEEQFGRMHRACSRREEASAP